MLSAHIVKPLLLTSYFFSILVGRAEVNSKVTRKTGRGLLFIPGEAFGHDLHVASAVLRLHEDRQLSVSSFPLEY